MHNVMEVDLAEYAKKINADGEHVVYTKDGSINIEVPKEGYYNIASMIEYGAEYAGNNGNHVINASLDNVLIMPLDGSAKCFYENAFINHVVFYNSATIQNSTTRISTLNIWPNLENGSVIIPDGCKSITLNFMAAKNPSYELSKVYVDNYVSTDIQSYLGDVPVILKEYDIINESLKPYIVRDSGIEGNTGTLYTKSGFHSIYQYPIEEGETYIIESPIRTLGTVGLIYIHSEIKQLKKKYSAQSQKKFTVKAESKGFISFELTPDNVIDWSDLNTDNLAVTRGKAILDLKVKKYHIKDILAASDKPNDSMVRQTDIEEIDGGVATGFPGLIIIGENAAGHRLAKFAVKKDENYCIEVSDLITGTAISLFKTVGGVNCPIAIGGKKKIYFKPHEDGIFYFMYKADFSQDIEKLKYDLTGKYKIYRINKPGIIASIGASYPFNNDVIDCSHLSALTIEKPKWCTINFSQYYHAITVDKNYRPDKIYVEYRDSNNIYFKKLAEVGGQGSSSMSYTNRNSKLRFFNEDGSKFYLTIGDWIARRSFHIKVYWVDYSMVRNNGMANFITDWYRDRDNPTSIKYDQEPDSYSMGSRHSFDSLYKKSPRYVIDGVPCAVQTFGSFWCNGSLNLNAFAENFGLNETNPLHRGYRGFLANKNTTEEMVSDLEGDAMTDEVYKPFKDFKDWYTANRGSSAVAAFKAGDGVHYLKEDLMDYFLLMEWFFCRDNSIYNLVFNTKNGTLFRPYWYDMDSHSGHIENGFYQLSPNVEFYSHNDPDLFFWKPIVRAFPNEIKNRYHDLRRTKRFSAEKYREIFGGWLNRYPQDWFEMDYYMWMREYIVNDNYIPNLEQNMWWIDERLKFLDAKYGYVE